MRASLTLLSSLSWLLALTPFNVHGQETTAVCMDSFSWAFNSLHQSPCQVASYLLGQCTMNSHVDALPLGSHYGGPTTVTGSTPCQCNTITFSLLSACGSCQNRTIESWSVYSAQCSYVYIEQFPEELPDVPIPGWAFLDVKATDGWNLELARSNANLTEVARPKPASSSALSSPSLSPATSSFELPSSSIAPTASATAPETQGPPTAKQYTNAETNAIIGGIVGGACGAMLLLIGAFVFKRRREAQKRRNAQLQSEQAAGLSGLPQTPSASGTSLPTKETA